MTQAVKLIAAAVLLALPTAYAQVAEPQRGAAAQAGTVHGMPGEVVVPAGTRVPLVMVNSVSSKQSEPGDPVYLESVYPVVVDGRVLIPAGAHVSGMVQLTKRPGRVKGRGKLGIHLEQLILPNGVIRSLSGRPGAIDGRSPDRLDRETGTITAPGTKGEDAETILGTTAAGASVGTLAGALGRRTGRGLGAGAGGGLAIGLARVLLTRGAEAMLDRGTHVEMLLEQDLRFSEDELKFRDPTGRAGGSYGPGPDPRRNERNRGGRLGRFPL